MKRSVRHRPRVAPQIANGGFSGPQRARAKRSPLLPVFEWTAVPKLTANQEPVLARNRVTDTVRRVVGMKLGYCELRMAHLSDRVSGASEAVVRGQIPAV